MFSWGTQTSTVTCLTGCRERPRTSLYYARTSCQLPLPVSFTLSSFELPVSQFPVSFLERSARVGLAGHRTLKFHRHSPNPRAASNGIRVALLSCNIPLRRSAEAPGLPTSPATWEQGASSDLPLLSCTHVHTLPCLLLRRRAQTYSPRARGRKFAPHSNEEVCRRCHGFTGRVRRGNDLPPDHRR